jgi:hypothetical protein
MPSYTLTENSTSQNSSDTPTTGVTEDTWLQESDGGTVNHGTSTILEVTKFNTNDHNHTIIRFDSSSISASETVTSANIYLYLENNNAESHPIAAYELLQTAWTEGGATWLTYDGTNNWNTSGALGSGTDRAASTSGTATIGSTTGQYYSIDITGLVSSNLGSSIELHLEMDETGNSSDNMQFTSSEGTNGQRPELVIVTTTGGEEAAPIGSGLLNSLKLNRMRLIG